MVIYVKNVVCQKKEYRIKKNELRENEIVIVEENGKNTYLSKRQYEDIKKTKDETKEYKEQKSAIKFIEYSIATVYIIELCTPTGKLNLQQVKGT